MAIVIEINKKKINKYRSYGNESKEIDAAAANIYSGLGVIGLRDSVPPVSAV